MFDCLCLIVGVCVLCVGVVIVSSLLSMCFRALYLIHSHSLSLSLSLSVCVSRSLCLALSVCLALCVSRALSLSVRSLCLARYVSLSLTHLGFCSDLIGKVFDRVHEILFDRILSEFGLLTM